MKKGMMKLVIGLALTLSSFTAVAGEDNSSITCGVRSTALDVQTVFNVKDSGPVKVAMSPFTDDGRSAASKVINLSDGYRVSLSYVYAPDVNLNGNIGYAVLSVALQRVEANGKITVLALGQTNSNSARIILPDSLDTFLTMKNPEIETAILNSNISGATFFTLLKAGKLPNGIISEVSVNCSQIK